MTARRVHETERLRGLRGMPGGENKRRVVVSGIGLIGPNGVGVESFWNAILEGISAIDTISRFDASTYACQVAGEVRDRSYEELIDPRTLRNSTHISQLALGATELALRDARLPKDAYLPEQKGVSFGTALGGWREAEQQHSVLVEKGARRVNPFISNATPNHTPGALIASLIEAQGPQMTFSNGCPASLFAIGNAAAMIASGEIDLCLAGGAESPLIPTVVAGMSRTQELATRNDDPKHASRPFDREHGGLVLSEGSCVLVLESAEHAVERGAKIYGEILGFAASCDAQGLYGVDASGEAGARAIQRAVRLSGLSAGDIDYVCAHANSSPIFDRKDTVVIKKAFGEWAARLPVSSIKGVLGHPFGASGAFQVAASTLAIRNQIIPPTHNFTVAADDCDLDYVPNVARQAKLQSALVTSHGYGGVNAYLVVADAKL